MMNHTDKQAAIKAAADRFPATFCLRAFPEKTFRIGISQSYVNDVGDVQLYTQVEQGDKWLDFAKCHPAELDDEMRATPELAAASTEAEKHPRFGEMADRCECDHAADADTFPRRQERIIALLAVADAAGERYSRNDMSKAAREYRMGQLIGVGTAPETELFGSATSSKPCPVCEKYKAKEPGFSTCKGCTTDADRNAVAAPRGWNFVEGGTDQSAPVQTLDFTPPGLKTAEGAKAVATALDEWNASAHEVANLAQQFMDEFGPEIVNALRRSGGDANELQAAIYTRHQKQEAFLNALAGR